MRNAAKIIDEIAKMILSKNIEYNPNEYEENKLDTIKNKIEFIEKYV